jgi:6-phosphogluconolactonase
MSNLIQSKMSTLPANVRAPASTAELNVALGGYVADAARAAIAARGKFTVATSGGSLPKVLGEALQHVVDSGSDLQTELWHVFYVDERVVPLDHADSNHAATRAALYSKVSPA